MLKRLPSGMSSALVLLGKRPLLCLGGALLVVGAVAALWPRVFFTGDDAAIVRHLRQDTLAPFISPVLSQALSLGYRAVPDAPWFGLYLYAVHTFSLAVLWWLILACCSRRNISSTLRVLVMIAATLGFAVAVHRLTFSSVSILACAIALIGWVLEDTNQSRTDGRERLSVAAALGVLLALGHATRTMGLAGALAAVAPLLAWNAWRLFRSRRGPRLKVVALLIGPSLALILLGNLMPQTWDPMVQNYEAFNKERGALHGMAAFQQIDRRGPELLAQAGWSRREWLDFRSWLFLDEAAYPIEKLRRLRESGGRPYKLGDAATLTRRVIVSSYKGANHSIRFFAFVIAASLLVAAIAARRFLFVFGCLTAWLGYLYVLITWMLAHQRFPNRVSMPFYIATALAVASLVVAHLDDRPRALRAGRRLASLALALLVVVTGYHWVRDLGRFDPRADVEVQLAAFTSRLADRYDRGAVIVKDARVRLLYDPLAPPLPYEVVPLGWGTFSVPFYREINRLGISRGSELVPALVDNPNAYILIHRRRLRTVQGYIRRQVPHAQLEWVDAPETRRPFALYRVVSEADEGSERSPP